MVVTPAHTSVGRSLLPVVAVPFPVVSEVEPATKRDEPNCTTTCAYERDPLDRLTVIRRAGVDLTGAELLRLQGRGLSCDVVSSDEALSARDRE